MCNCFHDSKVFHSSYPIKIHKVNKPLSFRENTHAYLHSAAVQNSTENFIHFLKIRRFIAHHMNKTGNVYEFRTKDAFFPKRLF